MNTDDRRYDRYVSLLPQKVACSIKKEKQTYYPVSEMHGQNTVVDSLWIQYVYTSFVLTKLNNESETNTTVIVV